MTEEQHNSPIDAGLRLIKDNGLIVVALAALAWQLYFISTTNAEQDAKWRLELAEYRQMMDSFHVERGNSRAQLAEALTGLKDTVKIMEEVMAGVEEECIRNNVRNEGRGNLQKDIDFLMSETDWQGERLQFLEASWLAE